MSSRTPRKKRTAAILRNLGFALALGLGGVGIWMIVTGGNSTQRIEIGVLIGLWGLLLGAICGRRLILAEPAAPRVGQSAPPPARANLAVPETAGLDRVEAAAARHAFAAELHAMLRRELASAVDNAIVREVGQLRAEIAELRSDLLERVNGQLRLQRIETTTLIGSDLDAMRAEVRGIPPALDPSPVQPFVESLPLPERAAPPPLPERAAPPPLQTAPADLVADPFAALPRLTPFTAFPLDPIEAPARTGAVRPAAGEHTGRPRAAEPPRSEPAPPVRDADAPAARPGGRRRRANDPEGQELLARLLAREGTRH